MANYYVSSVKYAALTAWAAGSAVSIGTIRKNLTGANLRVYRAESAGTTGASEPSWNTNFNTTTSDNGITWRNITGSETYAWTAAAATIGTINSAASIGELDTIYVDSTHSETSASAVTIPFVGKIISVDAAGSVPPAKADYLRGATVTVQSGGSNITINAAKVLGLNFIAGSATSTAVSINFGANGYYTHLLDCFLHLNNTGSSMINGTSTLGGVVEFDCNTKVRFGGNAAQRINFTTMSFIWRNSDASDTVQCPSGSWPTYLMFASSGYGSTVSKCIGLDLSAFGGTSYCSADSGHLMSFESCILVKSKCTISFSGTMGPGVPTVWYLNNTYVGEDRVYDLLSVGRTIQYTYAATASRANGALNAVSTYSICARLSSTNSNGGYADFPLVRKYNKDLGAGKVATLHGITFYGTLPKISEVNLDFFYNVNADTSFLADIKEPADSIDDGTLVSSDTSDWSATAPLRQNLTAYAQGDCIKIASNPGKLFCKTNTGSSTTAGSEPGGFATAVYGDTVSDGTCTWRCGTPFKLEATFTAAREGFITMQPRLRPVDVNVYYVFIDPKITVV